MNLRTQELEKLADQLRYRAFHDPLTGLPNRALLLEDFERAAAHADRVRKRFAVLLLDLDDFKQINDTFGHDFGDELLRQVARLITRSVRREDLVCRLGGDEFLLMVEDVGTTADLDLLGQDLIADLQSDIFVAGEPVKVTASIGVALYPDHGHTLSELKRKSDDAMYRAKGAGKNKMVVFNT